MSIPTPEGMYAIEEPLQDGNRLRCFSSGFGLRVARIEAPEGQLVGYGEAPTIDVALADAAENYHTGESYRRQYLDDDSRYLHRVYGSEKSVSPLDAHLHRGGKLLAHWACDAVVAGIYTLINIPTQELLEPLFEESEGKFPIVVTEFGRVYAISRTYNGLDIAQLPSEDDKNSSVCVVQNGTGSTLSEAIGVALACAQVESEIDIFH